MPVRSLLWRVVVVVGMAASVVLAGCTGVGVKQSTSTRVNALYAQLAASSKAYAAALADTQGSGQPQAMDSALTALRKAAARCGKTAGCDTQRFVSAYNHLLQLAGGSGTGEVANVTSGEAQIPVNQPVPQSQRTVTLLHGHKLSDLIAMNGPVKSALEAWLTWRRPQLMRSYIRYQYLRHLMWPKFKQAGLPEAVLFGILTVESRGKVNAVSSAGAKGPMQFMYATGARFGLHTVNGFDERFSPAMSAGAAAAYLDEQLKIFNDNLELVLAAYNAGEGRLRRLAGSQPGVSFYDPSIYFELPEQTRRYVPEVLAAAWLYLHPHSYHLHFPKIRAKPGKIKLVRQTSLSELTVCLGQVDGMRGGWFRTLRNLNPRVDPQSELPAGTVLHVPHKLESAYQSDCTTGPWPILAADLHSGKVPAPPPSGLPRHYVVKRGDTLSGIVNRLGCSSVHQIARMNHLRRPSYRIRVGQRLTLPRCY